MDLGRGTQSGKTYIKQYDAIHFGELPNPHVTDLVPPPSASEPPLDKSKPKKVWFDKSLRKRAVEDLTAP